MNKMDYKNISLFTEIKKITEGYLKPEIYKEIYECSKRSPNGIAVDIGPAQGASTISIALGYKYEGKEKLVYSIDRFESSNALKYYTDIDKNISHLYKNLKTYDVEKYVKTLVVGKDNLSLDEDIGILFIDADGAIDRDFSAYYEKVLPGGYIIIDDYKRKINIQAKEAFLKWENQKQINQALKDLGYESLLDFSPLGKQYTTVKFVDSLVNKGYIKIVKNLYGTIFAVKPKDAPKFKDTDKMELINVRQEIVNDYYERRNYMKLYYDKISSALLEISNEFSSNNIYIFENYYYEAKELWRTGLVRQYHSNNKADMNYSFYFQELQLNKFDAFKKYFENKKIYSGITQDYPIVKDLCKGQTHRFKIMPIYIYDDFWGFIILTDNKISEKSNLTKDDHFVDSIQSINNLKKIIVENQHLKEEAIKLD